MSGMFGGRPQQETTTAVSAPQLPAYLQPYMTGAANQAQSLYGSGQLAPSYFPGSTVAGESGATQDYYSAIQSLTNGGQPGALQQAATQQQLGTIQGNQLDASSNPYLQSAMDAANRGTVQQFGESVLPGLQANFSKAGRTSSGAIGNTIGRTTEGLARTLSDSNAAMAYNNYNDAANRQQASAMFAPQLAQGDFANADKLQLSGALQDARAQSLVDAEVDKYNYNSNLPQNALQNYINLLNGTAGAVGAGSTSTGIKYGDQTRTQSTLMQTAQLAAKLFSDIRLKTDIRPIGKLKSGLTVYAYRYKGTPTMTAGVMAQDVLKIAPNAVGMRDGFLTVNYAELAA